MTPDSVALLIVLVAGLWLALVAWGCVEWTVARLRPVDDCGCGDDRCRGAEGR